MARYIRPKQIPERHPGITLDTVRWWIANSRSNGLLEMGAISRTGRSIFIDEEKLVKWLQDQSSGVAA